MLQSPNLAGAQTPPPPLTPSPPIPKFRSQSFAACCGVRMGSLLPRLSTCGDGHAGAGVGWGSTGAGHRSISHPALDESAREVGSYLHNAQATAMVALPTRTLPSQPLPPSRQFVPARTRMKSFPRPWYLAKVTLADDAMMGWHSARPPRLRPAAAALAGHGRSEVAMAWAVVGLWGALPRAGLPWGGWRQCKGMEAGGGRQQARIAATRELLPVAQHGGAWGRSRHSKAGGVTTSIHDSSGQRPLHNCKSPLEQHSNVRLQPAVAQDLHLLHPSPSRPGAAVAPAWPRPRPRSCGRSPWTYRSSSRSCAMRLTTASYGP